MRERERDRLVSLNSGRKDFPIALVDAMLKQKQRKMTHVHAKEKWSREK